MAQIRNYQKGVFETKSLAQISQVTDSTNTFLQFDGILTNAFSNLVLYADAGGASPLPLTSYASTTTDNTATALEAETSTGGSGYTVYSQFEVSDATYQNVDLYATFTNFGTYTDNDAAFSQIGGAITISASGSIVPSDGYLRQIVTVDTSAGSVSLTVDPPEFIGQDIYILCDGTGLVDVDFDGKLATGNIVISDKLMLRLTAKSLTEWSAVNEITADYISGANRVRYSSVGIMRLNDSAGSTASLSGGGDWYVWVASRTLSESFSKVINPRDDDFEVILTPGSPGNTRPIIFSWDSTSSWTSSKIFYRGYSEVSGATVNVNIVIEGPY